MSPASLPLSRPPAPGLLWGPYPQRAEAETDAAASGPGLWRSAQGLLAPWLSHRGAAGWSEALRSAVRAAQARWQALPASERPAALAELRARLARDGWQGAWRAEALGCVAEAGERALAQCPHDTQLMAAHVLLDDQLAEMATGEGKTYAAALAAAVAALAGVPVHVMTANDYLVQRDADALRPFYAALGLQVGVVLAGQPAAERRAAYACHLTYVTAREVAFDYLRDQLAAGAAPKALARHAAALRGAATLPEAAESPVLRGLCMAVLDEADSLLIDDAGVPLVLSEQGSDHEHLAACFQALQLARRLQPGQDLDWPAATGGALVWHPAGQQRLDAWAEALGGAWLNRRHRHNLVEAALTALHRLQPDHHYLVKDGRIALLDAQTGRIAEGRVWSRDLQCLVELKEGLRPGPASQTRAQISFQRFFPRYLRLCGMSGTLAECRRELAQVYQRPVRRIPLRQASRRQQAEPQLFVDDAARQQAVLRRARELQASGQPLLVGVDSVAASEALSRLLDQAGLEHQVLNARFDADEARIIAEAGQLGAITVATQMAGRGTDIRLGEGVAERGGLQVLCCLDGLQPRLQRQLLGRAARQGDPGQGEVWHQSQAPALAGRWLSSWLLAGRQPDEHGRLTPPAAAWRLGLAWLARQDEAQRARRRRQTREQDRAWHTRLNF